MDQGSTMKRSAVHNFATTVTKFCVMWEGQALPHDTKFGNSRCEIVGRRVIFIWSLIHGLRWSGLIKAEHGRTMSLLAVPRMKQMNVLTSAPSPNRTNLIPDLAKGTSGEGFVGVRLRLYSWKYIRVCFFRLSTITFEGQVKCTRMYWLE